MIRRTDIPLTTTINPSTCSSAVSSSRSGVGSLSVRVWGLAIRASSCNGTVTSARSWEAILWRCVDELLVATTEFLSAASSTPPPSAFPPSSTSIVSLYPTASSFHPQQQQQQFNSLAASSFAVTAANTCTGSSCMLTLLDIHFNADDDDYYENDGVPNVSIIKPLLLRFARRQELGALRVLRIACNTHDEASDDEGHALLMLAPHLEELSFRTCGLTSLDLLVGGLTSLEKFGTHGSSAPLRSYFCESPKPDSHQRPSPNSHSTLPPQLRVLCAQDCRLLRSLRGLEMQYGLEDVTLSWTPITSICALRSSRNTLRRVDVRGCQLLTSLDGLEECGQLEEVDASRTAITSVAPLMRSSGGRSSSTTGTSGSLKMVDLRFCPGLSSAAKDSLVGVDIVWV